MNKLAFLIIGVLFLLGNFYIGRKLIFIVEQFSFFKNPLILWVLIGLLAIASMLTMLLFDTNVGSLIGKIGSYWLSFWFISLAIFGLTDLIMKIAGKITTIHSRTEFVLWLGATVLIVVLFCYGTWQAQQIRTVKYQVVMGKLVNNK
ncbi:hypothetical protein [Enterococcus sp. AZ126]|uniref:hypothetical protein n=1 Tax=Enterococcus sp. AZ126 TaxID=2774635 RepID=UPI003F29EB5A